MKYVAAILVILSLNLSSGPAGAINGQSERRVTGSSITPRSANRATIPHRAPARHLGGTDFTSPKAAVTYEYIWNNPLNQTAQQYVAILSLLEHDRASRLNLVEEEAKRIVERRKNFIDKQVRVVYPPPVTIPDMGEEKPVGSLRVAIASALAFLALLLAAITIYLRRKNKAAVGWKK